MVNWNGTTYLSLRSPIFLLRKLSNSSSPRFSFCRYSTNPSPLYVAAAMGKKPAKKPTTVVKETAAEGNKRSAELNKKQSEDVIFVPSSLHDPFL